MRTTADRIRHTLSFEIIGLAIAIPLGTLIFHHPMEQIGVVTVVASLIATAWNYFYNLGFDHAMLRLTGSVKKSVPVRVGHAVLFELGLLALMLPFVVHGHQPGRCVPARSGAGGFLHGLRLRLQLGV